MLRKLQRWISDHVPAWCCRCRYVMFAKNVRWGKHVTGAQVQLCKGCYEELYHPYGRGK